MVGYEGFVGFGGGVVCWVGDVGAHLALFAEGGGVVAGELGFDVAGGRSGRGGRGFVYRPFALDAIAGCGGG